MDTPLIQLAWAQCADDPWWRLEAVDLSTLVTTGVYIIWHDGKPGQVIRVGQGDIAFRLREHRSDFAIIRFRRLGPLRVTWASVPATQIDAVERYLAERLKPVIWDRYPTVQPIAVNLPFAA